MEHVTFSVFYLIQVLMKRGTFWWKPHLNQTSGFKVIAKWRILIKIESKRNMFLFLAVSHNQCSRLTILDRNTFCPEDVRLMKAWHLNFSNGEPVVMNSCYKTLWRLYSCFNYVPSWWESWILQHFLWMAFC